MNKQIAQAVSKVLKKDSAEKWFIGNIVEDTKAGQQPQAKKELV
jgi:hypothetical protein